MCLPWLFRFVPAAVVPRSCLGRRHFFLLSPFGQRLQSFIFLCHPIPPGCLPADGGHICLADFVMCFRRICRVAQCIEAQRVATAACCSRKTACSALPNGRFCIAERPVLHRQTAGFASPNGLPCIPVRCAVPPATPFVVKEYPARGSPAVTKGGAMFCRLAQKSYLCMAHAGAGSMPSWQRVHGDKTRAT